MFFLVQFLVWTAHTQQTGIQIKEIHYNSDWQFQNSTMMYNPKYY